MKPRSVTPLTLRELEKLPTPRLLAYLRRLRECEASIENSDWEFHEIASIGGIIFKSSKEWEAQYNLVKSVLAERPNIESGMQGSVP